MDAAGGPIRMGKSQLSISLIRPYREFTLSTQLRATLPSPTPVRRAKLTTLILDQLRQFVITHGLVENDRLPPERDLAIRLQVSRPTLRNALNWLHDREALRRVQGGGTFLQSNFLDVIAEYEGENAPTTNVVEVSEARLIIEPPLARLAAERINSRDLETLHVELRRGAQRLTDESGFRRHELQFHMRLAQAAGNLVMCSVLEPLLTRVTTVAARANAILDPRRSLNDHQCIVDAITRRDGHAASQYMTEHLRGCHQLTAAKAPTTDN